MSIYKYHQPFTFNKDGEKIDLLKYIFEGNTLRFSSPLNFNDPFEIRPHIEKSTMSNNVLEISISQHLNNTGQAHKFHSKVIDGLIKNVGILSLSGTHKNLTMWAHYADNHKGIVIAFDNKHKFFSPSFENTDFIHGLKKVQYVQKRLSVNSEEWLKEEIFLIKSTDWEYENEYRMTIILDESDNPDKYNIKFPCEIIRSIYIGCRADKETIDYIKNLKSQDQWNHLNIYQFITDEKEYKLVAKEVK